MDNGRLRQIENPGMRMAASQQLRPGAYPTQHHCLQPAQQQATRSAELAMQQLYASVQCQLNATSLQFDIGHVPFSVACLTSMSFARQLANKSKMHTQIQLRGATPQVPSMPCNV